MCLVSYWQCRYTHILCNLKPFFSFCANFWLSVIYLYIQDWLSSFLFFNLSVIGFNGWIFYRFVFCTLLRFFLDSVWPGISLYILVLCFVWIVYFMKFYWYGGVFLFGLDFCMFLCIRGLIYCRISAQLW